MQVLDHGFVELVGKTGHMSTSVIDAARCSYGSESGDLERDQKLVRFLLGNGHTSPFRHAFFTFHVKAPLFTFRQWWKYQVGSTWREYETKLEGYPVSTWVKTGTEIAAVDIQIDTDQGCSWNELSGRYKVMSPEFYMPAVARRNNNKQSSVEVDDDELTKRMYSIMYGQVVEAREAYEALLREGVARELARLVLPPSIYSECFWTVSLQAVLHFLDQRLAEGAQFEIRQYAQAVLELIRPDLEKMGINR